MMYFKLAATALPIILPPAQLCSLPLSFHFACGQALDPGERLANV